MKVGVLNGVRNKLYKGKSFLGMLHVAQSYALNRFLWPKDPTVQHGLYCQMMSSSAKHTADDWAEPFRVRYGKHDLGLHLDVRFCLQKASQSHRACVAYVSETDECLADQTTPVKRSSQAMESQSECWAPKRLRR